MAQKRFVALSRDHRVRFALVGLAVTGVHFVVLAALLPVAVPELANALAFVVATQANFAASYSWTWASRRVPGRATPRQLLRTLGLFNASALVAFGVNAAVFAAAHRLLGTAPLLSAVIATVVSAVASFAVSSRLVFAQRSPASDPTAVDLRVAAPASVETTADTPRPRSAPAASGSRTA